MGESRQDPCPPGICSPCDSQTRNKERSADQIITSGDEFYSRNKWSWIEARIGFLLQIGCPGKFSSKRCLQVKI